MKEEWPTYPYSVLGGSKNQLGCAIVAGANVGDVRFSRHKDLCAERRQNFD